MKKIKLYKQDDILEKSKEIKRHNAFIKRDGTFYLANSYMGPSSSMELDNLALIIGNFDIGEKFLDEYYENFKNKYSREFVYSEELIEALSKELGEEKFQIKRMIEMNINSIKIYRNIQFQKKRTILLQYYGYAIFARMENINWDIRKAKRFFERSELPNPEWYGMDYTDSQVETMRQLMELNKGDCTEEVNISILKKKCHYQDSGWHN